MKTKFTISAITGLCITGLLFLNSAQAEPKEADGYKIEVVSKSTSKAKIFWTRVSEEDGKLHVSGKIKRKNRQQQVPFGHIDIVVVDASGNVLMDNTVAYKPAKVNKLLRKASKFSYEFVSLPPKGSNIKVSYHKDPFQDPVDVRPHEKVNAQ